jgi:hypothetical protein
VILDSCFSGRAIDPILAGSEADMLADGLEISGTYTLAAAPEGHPERTDHEYQLANLAGVAATAALSAGRPKRAVELLERTRGTLAADTLGLRSDGHIRLREHAPDLADQCREAHAARQLLLAQPRAARAQTSLRRGFSLGRPGGATPVTPGGACQLPINKPHPTTKPHIRELTGPARCDTFGRLGGRGKTTDPRTNPTPPQTAPHQQTPSPWESGPPEACISL